MPTRALAGLLVALCAAGAAAQEPRSVPDEAAVQASPQPQAGTEADLQERAPADTPDSGTQSAPDAEALPPDDELDAAVPSPDAPGALAGESAPPVALDEAPPRNFEPPSVGKVVFWLLLCVALVFAGKPALHWIANLAASGDQAPEPASRNLRLQRDLDPYRRRVRAELERGQRDEDLWLQAFQKGSGEDAPTLRAYIELRAYWLRQEEREARARARR